MTNVSTNAMTNVMRRVLAAGSLSLLFLRAVVVSGVQTLRVILRNSIGGHEPPAGLIRMRFAPMNEQGATLLGCMITLTPGTTTVDIDMKRREMLLHLLDASQAEQAVKGIRRDFEPSLIVLFGEGRRR